MRKVSEIASEILRDWKKVNFAAVPYLRAMMLLDTMESTYGMDSADSIVRYFLGNATTYRGETARRIKKELNEMLK